jgi:hypothetical protein
MDKLYDVIALLRDDTVSPVGGKYEISITGGTPDLPAEIAPLYRSKAFQPVTSEIRFSHMLLKELSELYVIRRGEYYCLVKLPTDGIPTEERDKAIYNDIIGSKSGFLAYVAFLLSDSYAEASVEQQGIMDLLCDKANSQDAVIPSALYERLLRTAAYYPERLGAVESIMQKLDPELVDERFRELVDTFRKAVRR